MPHALSPTISGTAKSWLAVHHGVCGLQSQALHRAALPCPSSGGDLASVVLQRDNSTKTRKIAQENSKFFTSSPTNLRKTLELLTPWIKRVFLQRFHLYMLSGWIFRPVFFRHRPAMSSGDHPCFIFSATYSSRPLVSLTFIPWYLLFCRRTCAFIFAFCGSYDLLTLFFRSSRLSEVWLRPRTLAIARSEYPFPRRSESSSRSPFPMCA